MFFPHLCQARFTAIIITLLSLFTSPILSAKVDFSNLTLIETPYNKNLTTLGSSAISTKHTLSSFLTKVVAKDGLSTTTPAEEDQNLRYYQTGFRFDAEEQARDSNWEPLAVSTWQDTYNGTDADLAAIDPAWKGVTVVSWKDTATDNNTGVRVTFVVNGTDQNQDTPRKYAHVLLVENVAEKKGGGVTFDVLDAKTVGGLLWHGKWLYIGDGKNGLRVFDLKHIWKVDKKSAFGMEYILPQARTYKPSNFPAAYRTFTFDFFHLDRNSTPPSILVGNYEENDTGFTYLAKWALDGITGRLSTKDTNGNPTAFATWGYQITVLRVRGMIYAHGKYYIGRLVPFEKSEVADMNEKGGLYLWTPGFNSDPITGVLPRGVGGMAYSPDSDDMWAVSIAQGNKGVVGVNAGGYIGEDVPKPSSTKTGNSVPTQSNAGNSKDSQGGSGETSKPNTGAVIGGVIGGIAAGALLLCLLCLYCRRRAARAGERQLTSQEGDQYPSPGFGGYYKSEIPMIKSELDASSTQVDQPGYAAAVARSSAQSSAQSTGSSEHVEALDEWGKKKGAVRIPARKPVPMATPPVYGGKSEGPWVELPVVERSVEVP